MGIIAQEKFVSLLQACHPPRRTSYGYDPYTLVGLRAEIAGAVGIHEGSRPPSWLAEVDRASALECYSQIKTYIMTHGYLRGKALRPWFLDRDLTAALNRDETWWGFEFETGFVSEEARAAAIEHCWDNYDGVVFDAEGEGNAAVEITFTPQEQSKFFDKTAQAYRFMEWLSNNRSMTMRSGSTNIGTHLNISTKALTSKNLNNVCKSMNRTLGALEQDIDGVGNVRNNLFGRAHLYGGFFSQASDNSVWLEGKLFRTTYGIKQFDRYVEVAVGISKALEAVVAAYNDEGNKGHFLLKHYPYVANLYEVVREGEEPVIRWTKNGLAGNHNSGWELSNTLKTDKTPQTQEEIREEQERVERELAEKARLEAEEREKEQRRLAMYERGERPEGMPESYYWCDACVNWHNDEGDDWEEAA